MFKKDGKLFGKISIVDIAVVLILVLLVVGVYIKFSGNQTVQVAAGENIECTIRIKDVRNYTVEALKKDSKVFDQTSKKYFGEITEVATGPSESSLLLDNGEYKTVENSARENAYITVVFKGKAGESGYFTPDNRQIGVGSSFGVSTKFAQCWGEIVDMKVAE